MTDVRDLDAAAGAAAAESARHPTGASTRRLLGRSSAWSTLDVAVARLGQFAQGVVVARLLAPADFGVFAVALVVHAIVVNVSELGVSAALICDPGDDPPSGVRTVSTIALCSSAVLGALMAIAAGPLARLLGSADAAPAIAVMALSLPLAGLSAAPAAMLRRHFRMDRLFVANAANTAVTAVVVILLALAGWGPLALACSWVAGQLLTTALVLTYRPGRVWPGWERADARRLLAFGLPLAGANILTFSILNVDYVIVGRLLGPVSLGLYVLAFNISGWPVSVIGTVVRSVSLPGFAQLQREGRSLSRSFAPAARIVSSLALPVCFLLVALSRPLIETVYGEKWSAASGALVGLALMGAARVLGELSADFLVASGRTRSVFAIQWPWLAALTVALLVGASTNGIVGVGAAQALVAGFVVLPIFAWLLAGAGVPRAELVRALLPATLWSLAGATAAYLVASRCATPATALVAGASVGLAVSALRWIPVARRAVGAGSVALQEST